MILLALAAVTTDVGPVRSVPKSVHFVRSATGVQETVDAIAAAERAFARRAQVEGQWRAFRETAAPDAFMYVPSPKPVAQALATASEPSVPVMWWPATIAPSCDGTLGISTGAYVRAASAGVGTFTTVWRRTASGYRWQMDQGRPTPHLVATGNTVAVIAPVCSSAATDPAARAAAYDRLAASVAASAGAEGASAFAANATSEVLVQAEGAMPVRGPAALPPTRFGAALASGHADDWTLAWASRALLGGAAGAHDLRVWQWRGDAGWKLVMYETIGLK